jgi:hypothetical protein
MRTIIIILALALMAGLIGCIPNVTEAQITQALADNATWMRNSTGNLFGYYRMSQSVYRWGFYNSLTDKTSYSGPLIWSDIQLYVNFYRAQGYQYVSMIQISPPVMTVIVLAIQRAMWSMVWFIFLPKVDFHTIDPVIITGYPSP